MHILLHCGKFGQPLLFPMDRVSVNACAPQGKGAVTVNGVLFLTAETGQQIRDIIAHYGDGIASLASLEAHKEERDRFKRFPAAQGGCAALVKSDDEQLASAGACIVNALWHRVCSQDGHGAQRPPLMYREGTASHFTEYADAVSMAAVARLLRSLSCTEINAAVEIHKEYRRLTAGGEA